MEWKTEELSARLPVRKAVLWDMGMPVMPADVSRFYRKESPWHRDWKMAFPEHYREKVFIDQASGEMHRADIFTACGTTLEFQHSPITALEIASREAFYPNLVWILNGAKLKGFRLLKHLPDVDDSKLAAYEFCHSDHLAVVSKADIDAGKLKPRTISFAHPEMQGIKMTAQYYSFCWKNPHTAWFSARCRMIVDMGGHFLYEIKKRKQINGDYAYLKLISRKAFVEGYI
ncbi:competence protein [Pedobacter sp.]|uniref:competence protein n=1 Tax=Pedobacter sp. TaxID=1411316 RepID=UPI003BAB177F